MIAPLELVKGMPLIPHACMLCSNNPVDEINGGQQEAVFAPGVDYDWGNSAYICKSCGELIADLFGRVPLEEHTSLMGEYRDLKEAYEKLEDDNEKDRALLDRIRDGKQAIKEVKSKKAA